MKTLWQLILILPFVISCNSEEKADDVFKYNETAGVLTLDPAFAKDLPHIWVCNQLYNGLVELDSKLNIKPSLATDWNVSPDGLLYEFHLRTDVFFHDHPVFDGAKRKFVAKDVVYSFNRLLDERLASPGRWIFNQVARNNDSLDIIAINDSTLQIRLARPFPAFLSLLGMAYASVIPSEVVAMEGQEFRRRPVGTGPFFFKFWEEGVRLVFRKNPHYFEMENGVRLPKLEAVSVSFLSDKQTAFMEFIKGRLDFMSGIDARYKDELLTRKGYLRKAYADKINLIREPYLNTEYLGFFLGENKKSPLSAEQYLALRKAINYGIDREKMLRYLRNNVGYPGHSGMIPKGLQGYDTTTSIGYKFDQDIASQLVKANKLEGYEITVSVTNEYVDLVKYIQAQLGQIGIKIKIEVLPTATLRLLRAQGKLEVFRASWVADYADAENYLSLFYSPNFAPVGPNYTHFADKTFDSLFENAYSIADINQRAREYRTLDSIVMSNAAVVVLYYDEVLRFTQKNIHNFEGNLSSQLDLKRVWKSVK